MTWGRGRGRWPAEVSFGSAACRLPYLPVAWFYLQSSTTASRRPLVFVVICLPCKNRQKGSLGILVLHIKKKIYLLKSWKEKLFLIIKVIVSIVQYWAYLDI